MNDEVQAVQKLQGRVKWFDPVKGFGFIVADGSASDILLHANVLRNFGQSTIADGTAITVSVQQTQRGVQAIEVLEIEAPSGVLLSMVEEGLVATAEEIAVLPLKPARVKWFDKAKGFGFANIFGSAEDVFVHIEVLRSSGFADLASGEAVALRTVDGRRGQMAVQVLSWEVALRTGPGAP